MSVSRYLHVHPKTNCSPSLRPRDYVVATKYADGDPGDHFCVGYYDFTFDHAGQDRHMVSDEKGKPFRANGFRRVKKVSVSRGNWMVEHLGLIERMKDRFSVWHWVRAPWSELHHAEAMYQ